MKTRLYLFLAGVALWSVIYGNLLSPVAILARQAAAVASVANSNTAYVTQQAVESSLSLPWFFAGLVALFLLCFTRPILNALKSPSQS